MSVCQGPVSAGRVNTDAKGQGDKNIIKMFYNSACHKKNIQACFARGNKGMSIRSVNRGIRASDESIKKVGNRENWEVLLSLKRCQVT